MQPARLNALIRMEMRFHAIVRVPPILNSLASLLLKKTSKKHLATSKLS